jgi:type IV pilus assembly protein PilM
MANRVLSIEIGNSSTQIIDVDYKTKNRKVYDAVRIRNPRDIVSDGIVQPTEEYVEQLRTRLAEAKIKTKDCIFTITSTRIASREVTIPNVKQNRIEGIIKANAQDYFPIDLEQYEIGFHMVGNGEVGEDGKLRVMALAVPKTLLNSYYELAAACGLNVVGFDYTSNSIYQVLKDACGEGVNMVLKVDETTTTAMILHDGEIAMQRTVSYGVEEAITIVGNSKLFGNINYNSAIPMLRNKNCINRTLHPEDLEWDLTSEEDEEEVDDRMKALKGKVTASLEPVINSISRVIDYYNSRNSEFPIDNVYVTGVGGDFVGISKLMTNCLEIKVSPLSHLDAVTFGRSLKDSSLGEYIACLGAVVNPVGLVDKEKQKAANVTLVKGTNYTFVAVAVLVLGIIVAVALAVSSIIRLTAAESETLYLNAKKTQYSEAQSVYDTYQAVKAQNDKYAYLYYYTQNQNENLVAFINELEEILPSSFYTESFTSDANGISMSVTVNGKAAAAKVIQNLRDMETIENVSISGISDSVNEAGESTVTFSISGTYKQIELPGSETEEAEQNQ